MSTSTLCPVKALRGWSHKVEECPKTTPLDREIYTDDCRSGQASTQKQVAAPSDPKLHIYICDNDCHSHAHWVFQPYTTLLQPSEKLIKLKTKTKTNTLGCIIHGHLWPTEASIMMMGTSAETPRISNQALSSFQLNTVPLSGAETYTPWTFMSLSTGNKAHAMDNIIQWTWLHYDDVLQFKCGCSCVHI